MRLPVPEPLSGGPSQHTQSLLCEGGGQHPDAYPVFNDRLGIVWGPCMSVFLSLNYRAVDLFRLCGTK